MNVVYLIELLREKSDGFHHFLSAHSLAISTLNPGLQLACFLNPSKRPLVSLGTGLPLRPSDETGSSVLIAF